MALPSGGNVMWKPCLRSKEAEWSVICTGSQCMPPDALLILKMSCLLGLPLDGFASVFKGAYGPDRFGLRDRAANLPPWSSIQQCRLLVVIGLQ
ncbi:hypothetical protein Nepgr_014690 [Nepenthes gracilis]|uniref:Uncharacterized protein n=1 Tax=Nepenthes gracilis TaxID=150966 RepID=A0AAD3SL95_NEPGR|nr:hypothetical protein Nepgr_014690 [Nepenthes gracilis]